MNTKSLIMIIHATTVFLSVAAFGQGNLTPPSAPMPSMKTLDQIESRIPISSLPYTITNSGSYYVTSNLYGSFNECGIICKANFVAIDLNGYTLFGNGNTNTTHGIDCPNLDIKIRNGTIKGWGGNGISGGRVVQVSNVTAMDNEVGIRTGSQSHIQNCKLIGNRTDGLRTGGFSIVSLCLAEGNGGCGIWLSEAGNGSVLDCISTRNNSGFFVHGENSIKNCFSSHNLGTGFYIGPNGSIIDCEALSNGNIGIQVMGNGIVSGNNIANNSIGIDAWNSRNRIQANNMTDNGIGMNVRQGGNLIINNSVFSSTNENYSVAGTDAIGPIILSVESITNTNPWANFSF